MKKYIIAVGSPEISTKVQEALFKAGFEWELCGGRRVRRLEKRFITVNIVYNRTITWSNNSMSVTHAINQRGRTLLSAQEVIENPFQLEGAKQPVKEMTVAEIQEKLGHDVKVIDG